MVVLKVSVEPFEDNLGPENLIPAPLFLFWGQPDMQLDCVEGGKHPPGILRIIQATGVGFWCMQESDRQYPSDYDWKSYDRMTLWLQDNLRNLFCGLERVTVA